MGLRNEHFLQQLLTQDHMKPLAKRMELAHTFEAAERETFKRVNTNNSENDITASKAKTQGQTNDTKERSNRHNARPVEILSHYNVQAMDVNILEILAIFEISNARDAIS